jgi:hypothetical protein
LRTSLVSIKARLILYIIIFCYKELEQLYDMNWLLTKSGYKHYLPWGHCLKFSSCTSHKQLVQHQQQQQLAVHLERRPCRNKSKQFKKLSISFTDMNHCLPCKAQKLLPLEILQRMMKTFLLPVPHLDFVLAYEPK